MIEIRLMASNELEVVDRHLPLDRLDQAGGEWLVAWEGDLPVGHAHLDLRDDPPALQNVYVSESHRRRGIASRLTAAAEELARERGFSHLILDVDVENEPARALYERLGYRQRGVPRRHAGTILLRGRPFAFDIVLVDLIKEL